MADPLNNPRLNWFSEMKEIRRSLQQRLESVELTQPDQQLAAEVRGIVSELKAMNAAIEAADKFFE